MQQGVTAQTDVNSYAAAVMQPHPGSYQRCMTVSSDSISGMSALFSLPPHHGRIQQNFVTACKEATVPVAIEHGRHLEADVAQVAELRVQVACVDLLFADVVCQSLRSRRKHPVRHLPSSGVISHTR